jgi:nucleoside phosphorylase
MTDVGIPSPKEAGHKVDFAIITALEIEAKAVVSRLQNRTVERFEDRDIRTYHCGTIPIEGTNYAYRVVVVLLPNMGELPAANATTDAVVRWNPQFVLMVGIAAGIPSPKDDRELGDVVVADQVIGYEHAKITEKGYEYREREYPASTLLLDRVRNFWDTSWTEYIVAPRPVNARRNVSKLHIGPIASGSKVVASAEFRGQLTLRWPKLVAVEMEAEGVFSAVFDRPQVRNTLMIRGICDMADERKSDEWQEYAASAAAAFVDSFLKSGPVEPRIRAGDKGEWPALPRSSPGPNPFVYGRPVQPNEFLDRESDLRTVFNRLRNGDSTAIVGEPHIGKTSLLMRLADEETQSHYLGDDVQRIMFSSLNLHYVSSDFSPTVFWEKTLRPLQKLSSQDGVAWRFEQPVRGGYPGDFLEGLFKYLHEHGQQLVLLLDEFDRLLRHPNFQFPFYATLRAIDAFPSFSLALASRFALEELEERVHELPLSGGSPVFNNLIEVRLLPFDEKDVNTLLDQAGDALSVDDRFFIRFMAGRHPYLVQAMAAALLGTTGEARYARAAELCYSQTCSHFNYLWRTLDDRARTTAIVLGLIELGRRKLGHGFDYGEIQSLSILGARLRDLARLGLAERASAEQRLSNTGCLLWQGERWTLGAQALTCWIYDVAIAETRLVPAYDEWLKNEGYRALLKRGQWDRLLDAVHNAVGRQICDIGTMAEDMFKELTEKRK